MSIGVGGGYDGEDDDKIKMSFGDGGQSGDVKMVTIDGLII